MVNGTTHSTQNEHQFTFTPCVWLNMVSRTTDIALIASNRNISRSVVGSIQYICLEKEVLFRFYSNGSFILLKLEGISFGLSFLRKLYSVCVILRWMNSKSQQG